MRESFIQRDERSQAEVIGSLRKMGLPHVDEKVRQFWSQFASPCDRTALGMLLIARFGDSWKRFFNDIPLCVYEIGDVDIFGEQWGEIDPALQDLLNGPDELLARGVFQYIAGRARAQGCSASSHTHCSIRPQPW
jgi:hypothetical protein